MEVKSMKGAPRFLLLAITLLVAVSLMTSCGKKQMVKSTSEEKATEIKEEVVPEKKVQETAMEVKDAAMMTFSDIHFDYDKSDILDNARPVLEKTGTYLLEHSGEKILVEGHCDERGTSEYNLALGERRAQSAKNYIVNLGVKGDRVKTISYGEEKPLDPGHSEEAWAKNRRAHFILMK
jgi:peptidoglycan-associated lipoprotein